MTDCHCCHQPTEFSILLIHDTIAMRRYLPNQHARNLPKTSLDVIEEVGFCHPCMRAIEDSLNATITARSSP